MSTLTDEELTKFGIVAQDEFVHPFDPKFEWWNESWFWDWYNADGSLAGHCRIGLHPAQKRAWVWFYAYHAGEWIVVEEPRLPHSDIQLPRLAYEGWGLRFSYDVIEPLRRARFQFSGFGRVVSGPRTGMILPVGADLHVQSIGAAHSTGRSDIAGHSSATFDACRFEQPITLQGTLQMGEVTQAFAGRGERDHSWGPRLWNLEWTFLVLNGERLQLQCAEVRLPGGNQLGVGYMHRDTTRSLSEVKLDVQFHDDSVLNPVSGRVAVRAEDGSTFAARLEVVSAAEIDITHTFVPPERSIYRRALIRVHPEDGGGPLVGWIELNYFLRPPAAS